MDYTAKAAALNLALRCDCEVVIVQPPLYVTVTRSSSVLLSWDRPTQREDGTPLAPDEIRGYVIEYDDQRVEVTGYSHTVEGLPPGRYSFRIATIDSDGRQGAFSEAVLVELP